MICPNCRFVFQDEQKVKAGKARWANVSATERSALALKASNERWKKMYEAERKTIEAKAKQIAAKAKLGKK